MKRIWLYIICAIIWVVVIARGYYAIKWNIVQDKIYSYLETYGYTEDDIERVSLNLKFSWKNEWQIVVEFKKEPKILYRFTYRNNEIIKDWVAAAKIPHKEFIEYENMFENGELKYNSEKLEISDMIYWDIIEEPQLIESPEENSPEVISWDGEENILVVEDENMNTDNVINLKIWNKTFNVTLEENSATKALIEKLHEWDVVVNAHEYWWFEKVGNLWFDLPRADKQITTEPGDIVLYQWNQVSLFYESNSWSYTKLWEIQMISKDGLKEILWDWDVKLAFSLLK